MKDSLEEIRGFRRSHNQDILPQDKTSPANNQLQCI